MNGWNSALHISLKKNSWDNFNVNVRPHLLKIKLDLIEGIKLLIEGKNKVLENLARFDNFDRFVQYLHYDYDLL